MRRIICIYKRHFNVDKPQAKSKLHLNNFSINLDCLSVFEARSTKKSEKLPKEEIDKRETLTATMNLKETGSDKLIYQIGRFSQQSDLISWE